jgi:hypothetical protein
VTAFAGGVLPPSGSDLLNQPHSPIPYKELIASWSWQINFLPVRVGSRNAKESESRFQVDEVAMTTSYHISRQGSHDTSFVKQ